jgi:hypothetical protein
MLTLQAMWFAVVNSFVALVVSADAMSLAMLVIIVVASVNFSLVVVLHNAQEGLPGTLVALLGVPLAVQAVLVAKQQPLLAVSAVEESSTEFVVQ